MDRKKAGYAALFTTSILWGSGFIAIKYAVTYMDKWWFISLRFLFAALIMDIVFFRKLKKLNKTQLKQGFILGAALAVALTFQIVGCAYTTVGKNAFLCSTYVIIIPFLKFFRTGEKPKTMIYPAVVLCMTGTAIVSLSGLNGFNIGDLLSIISGFAWAVHMELTSEYSEDNDMISLQLPEMTFAGIITLISAFIFAPGFSTITLGAAGCIIYTAVFCVAIGFGLQLFGQKYVEASSAGMIFSLEAVFAGFFAVIFLKEPLSLKLVSGGAMIFLSIIIASLDVTKIAAHIKKY